MVSSEIVIQAPGGLHVRPASDFVREAGKYKSHISIICDRSRVNGKSIMGLLSLGLGPGCSVTIEVDGPDEKEALVRLADFLQSDTL